MSKLQTILFHIDIHACLLKTTISEYSKTMRFIEKYTLYPFFFAVCPALALWTTNLGLVTFGDVWRSLLISLAAAAALFYILKLFRLDSNRAGLVVTLTVLLFFTYGFVIFRLARLQLAGPFILRPEWVTLFWPVAWILGAWMIIRLLKSPGAFNVFLNISAISLVILLGAQAAWIEVRDSFLLNKISQEQANISSNKNPGLISPDLPDIYYIILDGYGREDMLNQVIGLDNSEFIHGLEARGFYVADQSTSNYSNTAPSIASSLNFEYINDLAGSIGGESRDYRPIRQLIADSKIQRILKQSGYQMVTFETGFTLTEKQDSDYFISLRPGPNYFESLLLSNSFALFWINPAEAVRYRNRINGTLESIPNLSNVPSPKFVFAHVMAAHPPFVYDSNGEVKNQSASVTLDTGDDQTRQSEIQGYRDQVTYVNQLILKMVDNLLKNSQKPPVIILQGDHGSGIFMDWQLAGNTCFTERKAILNAYYFPGHKTEMLTSTITPVNSFRVVLDTYFGENLPLLENKNYFSLWESPYNFYDVTGQAGNCPPNIH